MLRAFSKAVIREQPSDLLRFAATYFAKLAGSGGISLPSDSAAGSVSGNGPSGSCGPGNGVGHNLSGHDDWKEGRPEGVAGACAGTEREVDGPGTGTEDGTQLLMQTAERELAPTIRARFSSALPPATWTCMVLVARITLPRSRL